MVLPAASARAAEPDPRTPSTLTAGAAPAVVAFGGSAVLSGRLEAGGVAVAGAMLTVAATTDGLVWSAVAEPATDGAGAFSLPVTPGPEWARTTYRVTFAGDAELLPCEALVQVGVQAGLDPPSVPTAVGRDSRFVVSGVLRPPHPSGTPAVTIHCFVLKAGEWVDRAVFDGIAEDVDVASSRYRAAVRLPSAGTWRLRVLHEDAGHARTWSAWSRSLTVTPRPDEPIWDRDGVTTIPERMESRLNSRQLIVITGRRLGSRTGMLRLYDYTAGDWTLRMAAPVRFGTYGLTNGLTRRAGSRTTPTGIWRMSPFAFGFHASAPSGCGLPWRRITRRSWWSARHDSTYNTWVESARFVYGEHLADYPRSYEFAVHTGYNALPNQRVFGRGTAIFIHVVHPGYSAGCILLARSDMISLLRRLDAGERLSCAIGTTRSGTTTCVSEY